MFRNFTFNDIDILGEVMLAVVAFLVPVLTFVLFLTNKPVRAGAVILQLRLATGAFLAPLTARVC